MEMTHLHKDVIDRANNETFSKIYLLSVRNSCRNKGVVIPPKDSTPEYPIIVSHQLKSNY